MQLTTYSTAQDFLAQMQPILMQNEAANDVMLGVALRLARGTFTPASDPYMATVADHTGLALAALMTPPHNVILYGHDHRWAGALETLARDLHMGGWSVPGCIGAVDLAQAFAETWTQVTGIPHRIGIRQRTYELRQVRYTPDVPGQFRQATLDDLDLVSDWFVAFEAEALGQPPDAAAVREGVTRRIAEGSIYLWDDGQPVSLAAWTRPMPHGIAVGPVYTPPQARGRGYASAVVARLSQLLLDQGYEYCCLHTDLANPTANSIYQRIGYTPITDGIEYRFGSSS